jgi:hypothetical protein
MYTKIKVESQNNVLHIKSPLQCSFWSSFLASRIRLESLLRWKTTKEMWLLPHHNFLQQVQKCKIIESIRQPEALIQAKEGRRPPV